MYENWKHGSSRQSPLDVIARTKVTRVESPQGESREVLTNSWDGKSRVSEKISQGKFHDKQK